jgi:hypothetical protein
VFNQVKGAAFQECLNKKTLNCDLCDSGDMRHCCRLDKKKMFFLEKCAGIGHYAIFCLSYGTVNAK